MTHATLSDLEEYSPDRPVIKPVFEGAFSFSKAIHLQPGQSVPVHPHPGKEVILLPQKGVGTLIWADGSEQALNAGTVYYQGLEPKFGIDNNGSGPFQMLIIAVRMTGGAE